MEKCAPGEGYGVPYPYAQPLDVPGDYTGVRGRWRENAGGRIRREAACDVFSMEKTTSIEESTTFYDEAQPHDTATELAQDHTHLQVIARHIPQDSSFGS